MSDELYQYFKKVDHLCDINNVEELNQMFIEQINNFSPSELNIPIALLSATHRTKERYEYRDDLIKILEEIDPKLTQGF